MNSTSLCDLARFFAVFDFARRLTGRFIPRSEHGSRGKSRIDQSSEDSPLASRTLSMNTKLTAKQGKALVSLAQGAAAAISTHLRRFERDPAINITDPKYKVRAYYGAFATFVNRNNIHVQYVSYQGQSRLTLDEALAYLAWLDAGNVGSHAIMAYRAKQAAREAPVTETTVTLESKS